MNIAKVSRVSLVCKECGKTFMAEKNISDIKYAGHINAGHWKMWAKKNKTICPDCHQKYKDLKDNEAKNREYHIVRMKYAIYKRHYSDCKKSPYSYDKKEKTIAVYLDENHLKEYKQI